MNIISVVNVFLFIMNFPSIFVNTTQVAANIYSSPPNSKCMLDVKSYTSCFYSQLWYLLS